MSSYRARPPDPDDPVRPVNPVKNAGALCLPRRSASVLLRRRGASREGSGRSMVKLLAVEGAASPHRFAFLARERGPSAATPPARASSVVLTTRTATVYG